MTTVLAIIQQPTYFYKIPEGKYYFFFWIDKFYNIIN